MSILIAVTEERNNAILHKNPVAKLYGIPFMDEIRANGAKAVVGMSGKNNNEIREVSESKATLDALVDSGYLDFMLPVNVKAVSGNRNDSYPYAYTITASNIVEVYADPQDANDSVIRVRENERKEDIFYTVDETIAAIVALIPIPNTGGGISDVTIGNSLFVSSEGTTIAGGAVRDSIVNHFSSMSEAKSVAVAGDTIYVYGDQTPNTNLYKKDVTWQFMGNPTITNNQFIFDDGAVASGNCVIRGNANFSSTNGVFNFDGAGTTFDVECENAITTGGVACQLIGSTGTINATGTIQSSTGATFYIDGATTATVNAKKISGVKSNGLVINTRGTFTGRMEYNAELITGTPTSAGSNVCYFDPSATGETIINVSDKIEMLGSAATSCAIRPISGNITVNGNIDSGVGYGVNMQNISSGLVFTHNGEATNDGSLALVYINAGGTATVTLNGDYTSANADVIYQNGAGSTLFVNGRIENTNALAVTKSGVNVVANAATIFENVIIIMDTALGTADSVTASAPQNIKVFHSLGANSALNVNITNLIAGAVLNIDTDYQ